MAWFWQFFQQPLVYWRSWSLFALQVLSTTPPPSSFTTSAPIGMKKDFTLAGRFKWVSHLPGIFVTAKILKRKRTKKITVRFTNIVKANNLLFGEVSKKDLTTTKYWLSCAGVDLHGILCILLFRSIQNICSWWNSSSNSSTVLVLILQRMQEVGLPLGKPPHSEVRPPSSNRSLDSG